MAEAAKPGKDWSYEEVGKRTCRFYYWEQEQRELGSKVDSGEQLGNEGGFGNFFGKAGTQTLWGPHSCFFVLRLRR